MKTCRGFIRALLTGVLAALVVIAPVRGAFKEYYNEAEWTAAVAGVVIENLNSLTTTLTTDYTLSTVPYVVGTHTFELSTLGTPGPSLRRSGSFFDQTAWLGWSGTGSSVRYTKVTVPSSFGVAINYYASDVSNDSDGRPHNSFYFRNVTSASGTWSALVNDSDEGRSPNGFYGIVDDQGGITSYVIGTTTTNFQSFGADNFRYATSLASPAAQVWYGDGMTPGNNGQWTTAGNNWRAGTVTGPFVATALATFPFPDGLVQIQPTGMTASGGLKFLATTAYELAGGRLTLGGQDAAKNTVLVEPSAVTRITAPVTATNGLTKSGSGELVLGGAGSVLGAVTVSEGTLTISATHTYIDNTTVAVDATQGLLAFGPTGSITAAAVITGGPVSHTGTGTTFLTGANTYTGLTTLLAGAHVLASAGALPGGIGATGGTSALTFDGGVLGLGAGNYARPMGATGTVDAAHFTGAGGWAAYGADRTVNVGGAGATVDWGAIDTGFNGQTLILGAGSATHTVDLVNPVDLGLAGRTVRGDDGAARIDGRMSGVLSGTSGGTLTKTGAGTVELTATNTYSDATVLEAGVLVAGSGGAIPGGIGTTGGESAITFTGGVLGLGAGNYSRPLAAAGTVDAAHFAGAGGWAAYWADRTVNVGGSGATIDWGTTDGGFNGQTLILGAGSATHTVDLVNPVELGEVGRTLQGGDGSARIDGRMSGVLSGTSGGTLTKTGAGTVELTATNTYSDATVLEAGVLVAGSAGAIPGGLAATGGTSAITFTGGVLGLGVGNYSRPLAAVGTADAANFAGAGGWAAYGADRMVDVGGSGATIAWGTADTGLNGQTLILGAGSATHTVDLVNPLDLGAAVRTVRADDGSAAVDGRISGVIGGSTGGGLVKTGLGTLELTAANTYTGPTTVSAGTLRVGNAQALGTSAVSVEGGTLAAAIAATLGNVTLGSGGALVLDSAVTRTVSVSSLSVDQATGALVDVGVGRIQIAAGADAAAIRADLIAGRGTNGNWTGTEGILSSVAATSGGTRAVGYRVAGDTSAVVAFAAPGDTDLDGVVNTLDLVAISAGGKFGTGAAAVWSEGDFNYDGVVNSLDLVAIASSGVWGTGNYLPLPTTPNPVPEPATLGLLAAAAIAGLAIRRR